MGEAVYRCANQLCIRFSFNVNRQFYTTVIISISTLYISFSFCISIIHSALVV